jgi:hypothetical protein
MGATVVATGTDALGSLGNRSQGNAFMNGSWMSREVHVQFWERVGVKLPPRDSPAALQAERNPGARDRRGDLPERLWMGG